jgi:formyl-CoA transferase
MPTGNPHPNLIPYDKYPTRTCEIFIASGNNGQFRKLCELLGMPGPALTVELLDELIARGNAAAKK